MRYAGVVTSAMFVRFLASAWAWFLSLSLLIDGLAGLLLIEWSMRTVFIYFFFESSLSRFFSQIPFFFWKSLANESV